ncbi:hypothetical protein ACFLTE_07140 [Bacteroidota bacterium]
MAKLYDQFKELRDEKSSIIILGLDPKTEEQREKVVELSKIKEGLIGFKPNLAFYQDDNGRARLEQIAQNAGSGMIRLLDLKSPDGAATNYAALKEYSPFFEYVTIAPGAGCIEETIEKARDLEQETISMGAMSFPGVLREINAGLPLFKQRVDRAIEAGTSAFVLGATAYIPEDAFEEAIVKYRKLGSDKAITEAEVSDHELKTAFANRNELFSYILEKTTDKDILYLVPGFGRQGGSIEHFLASGIDLKRCMINAGSDILKAENPETALAEMNKTFNKYIK